MVLNLSNVRSPDARRICSNASTVTGMELGHSSYVAGGVFLTRLAAISRKARHIAETSQGGRGISRDPIGLAFYFVGHVALPT